MTVFLTRRCCSCLFIVTNLLVATSVSGWLLSKLKYPKRTSTSSLEVPLPAPAFRKWCEEVGIKASKLEHSCIDGIPGISVRHTTTLLPGECAIVLPVDACIVVLADEVDTVSSSSVPNYLSDKAWQEAPPKLRLACTLLKEYHKGESSYYKGYIDHLPPISGPGRERCDTLDGWSEAEISLLKSPLLQEKLAERAELDNMWFASLEPESCSRLEFDWAVAVVRTRAFLGDYSVPNNGEADDIALLPFIDDLNHRESLGFKEQGSHTFPPVMQVLGRTHNAVCWVAHEAHKAGAEVAHSYKHGAEGLAEDFLYEWGFTPNELGANIVQVEGVQVVMRKDGCIDNRSQALQDICQAMSQKECDENKLSDKSISDADVYQCIARQCDIEILNLQQDSNDNNVSEAHNISPHRLATATSFLAGKERILKAGLKWAQDQAAMHASGK